MREDILTNPKHDIDVGMCGRDKNEEFTIEYNDSLDRYRVKLNGQVAYYNMCVISFTIWDKETVLFTDRKKAEGWIKYHFGQLANIKPAPWRQC